MYTMKCIKYDTLASNVEFIGAFQENDLFQCKLLFCIHNEDTWLKKYAHNIVQNEVQKICHEHSTMIMMMSSSYHTMKVKIYCLLMMFVHVGN